MSVRSEAGAGIPGAAGAGGSSTTGAVTGPADRTASAIARGVSACLHDGVGQEHAERLLEAQEQLDALQAAQARGRGRGTRQG